MGKSGNTGVIRSCFLLSSPDWPPNLTEAEIARIPTKAEPITSMNLMILGAEGKKHIFESMPPDVREFMSQLKGMGPHRAVYFEQT